jgi:hypothetical protein
MSADIGNDNQRIVIKCSLCRCTQSVDGEACNHVGPNHGGNFRGNTHCLTDPPTNPEPVRDCDSPNALKDNDGGRSICRLSGNDLRFP